MTTGDDPAPSPTVLPQKVGTISFLPLDRRHLAILSRPLLFRTDRMVENTESDPYEFELPARVKAPEQ